VDFLLELSERLLRPGLPALALLRPRLVVSLAPGQVAARQGVGNVACQRVADRSDASAQAAAEAHIDRDQTGIIYRPSLMHPTPIN